MIADGIPEIAQALRLGHVLKDKVQETYSHVATSSQTPRPLGKAVVDNTWTTFDISWRDAA